MTFRVTIELAGNAVAKGRHRSRIAHDRGGQEFVQNYPDGKTAKYEAQLRWAGAQAMLAQQPGVAPVLRPCRVVVDVYMPVPQNPQGGKRGRAAMLAGAIRPTKKPDADNYLKTVGDALNGVVWKDDSNIAEAIVRKWWAEHPRLVVIVETIEPPAIQDAQPLRATAGGLFAGAPA